MDSLKEGLICKAKSIVSSLSAIMLWVSRLPSSPTQTPKEFSTHHQLGLKTLIFSKSQSPDHKTPNHASEIIIHSYMSSSSSLSSSPSLLRSLSSSSYSLCSSSIMDDLIGTESGVYMSSDEELKDLEKPEPYIPNHGGKPNQRCAMTRPEYPPPIPLLAQTGNLPGRMPWVLTRHYTDGKLILKVERVQHHEYFKARRENGRLILNLVPLEPFFGENNEELELEDNLHLVEEETKDKIMEEDVVMEENQEIDGGDDDDEDDNVDETSIEKKLVSLLASSLPGMVFSSNSLSHEQIHSCLSQQPGSVPLRPMTAVM